MANPLSSSEFLFKLQNDKDFRDVIVNPNTDMERFTNTGALNVSRGFKNLDNLTSNIPDLFSLDHNSDIMNRVRGQIANHNVSRPRRLYNASKEFFSDNKDVQGGLSGILGLINKDLPEAFDRGLEDVKKEEERLNQRDALAGIYSGGGAGKLFAEMALSLPNAKLGTLVRTRSALQNPVSALDTATKVAKDTVSNIATIGGSEFALDKLYGKSDAEALANTVASSVLAGVGTPALFGVVKGADKIAKAEIKLQNKLAGGGTPDIKTKKNRKFNAPEVAEGKKNIESIEYDTVEPKTSEGIPLKGQIYVPKVNNPQKFKYGYDERGRVYVEEGSLLSPQGGATQKATLQQRPKHKVNNVKEEVERRLEFYDREKKLRESYGQTQADFKGKKFVPEVQRLNFEKAQYRELLNDKTIPKEELLIAKKELANLDKVDTSVLKPTEEQISKATEEFNKQIELTPKSDISRKEYEREIKEQYKSVAEKNKIVNPTKSDAETVEAIRKNALDKVKIIRKDADSVMQKERLAGRDFDIANINDIQRKKYPDEIARIEEVQNAKNDLKAYYNKEIDIEELRFREQKRVEADIKRNQKESFDRGKELKDFTAEQRKQFDDIGIKTEETKFTKDEPYSGEPEALESRVKRELKEKKESFNANTVIQNALKAYKKGTVLRNKKTGEPILSKEQMNDIDRGILNIKEIADKTSPVGIKSDMNELKLQAKKLANAKVTKAEREKLGIGNNLETKDIQFKDTLLDASNSVAQVSTALLGSKRLASITKSGGKDNILKDGEATDIRDIVGETMSKNLPDDFPIKANKDSVKPIFMTENYGQGKRGLITNIAKKEGVSKKDATQFFNEYEKAFDSVAPEMAKLREAIMEALNKTNGTVKYTMPDGFKVEFEIKKTLDGKYTLRGKNIPFKVKTDDLADFKSAILPNVIHSVDSYVARAMNKKGIATVHDAYQTPVGKTDEWVQKQYGEVMASINDSNLLDDILTQIGGKETKVKIGDLDSAEIKASAKSGDSVVPEEVKGLVEKAKVRENNVETSMTEEDIMKEFMASGNVREGNTGSLIKQMTNESGFRTMSVAKEGDDVFERQVALAHQSSIYNEKMSVKAPDGVDKLVWDKAQREIFNEARSRLEYNPLLRNVIQGDRKFFTKSGAYQGGNKKTFKELLEKEMLSGKKIYSELKPIDANKIKSVGKDYKEIKSKVESYTDKKVLNQNEIKAKQIVDESKINSLEEPNAYKTLWNEQVETSEVYNQFNDLERFKKVFKSEVDRNAEMLHDKLSKIPKEKQAEIKVLIDSDYEAIRGMHKSVADRIWKNNEGLYKIINKEVDQMAKGLSKESEQYGAWLANSKLVASRYNLGEGAEKIIDQLISIKAMNDNNAWRIAEKLKDDVDSNFVLDTFANKRLLSENHLFVTNPEDIIKGYRAEVYRGNKRIDENNKVRYDAEDRYEEGVIGSEKEANTIGKLFDTSAIPNEFSSLEEELNWMTRKKLRKTNGKYRKVASEKLRVEAGKIDDLVETIVETTRATNTKIKEQGLILKIIQDIHEGNSLLYSKEAKNGFVEVTEEQAKKLPFDLKNQVRFVNKEFMNKLLGRDEVRLYRKLGMKENNVNKLVDRLLDNLGTAFKQNVVLKNPTSYLNAGMVNITMGASVGMTPAKIIKYNTQAVKDLTDMNKALKVANELKTSGKNSNRKIDSILKNNLLYQMERAGLSTNRVEGVVGDNDLLGSILEDNVPPAIFKIGKVLNLNQKTKIGRETLRAFSTVDTAGRYSLTKHFLDEGMSMDEAVKKANGLFGDMDKMVPEAVEMLDKYGIAPFLKWFTLTSPSLLKVVKDNPKKAIALGIGIYIIGQETNTNLSTVNPVEAMIDFAEGTLPFGTIEKVSELGMLDTIYNRANANVLPKYLHNAWRSPETLGLYKLRKHRVEYEPFKGFTQSQIDKIGEE